MCLRKCRWEVTKEFLVLVSTYVLVNTSLDKFVMINNIGFEMINFLKLRKYFS